MKNQYVSVSTDPVKGENQCESVLNYAKEVMSAGADFLHCDVMDGKFVPQKTIDERVVEFVNSNCLIPLDVHLMTANPQRTILKYKKAGANILTVHYEAFKCKLKLKVALKKIRKLKMLSGLSIKPQTEVSEIENLLPLCDLVLVMSVEPGKSGQKFLENAIKKIEQLNLIRKQKNLNFKIEVDGGINAEIAKKIASKGADIIVSGSYIFNAENKKEAINSLK